MPLACGVFCLEARGVKDGGALIGRQRAQDVEGATELLLAVFGHALEGLGGGANLLPALWRELLEGLIAGEDAGANGGRLRVQKAKAVEDAAALRGAEPVKAGLAAQGPLLLLECKVLVTLEPLGQVFVSGPGLRSHGISALHFVSWDGLWKALRGALKVAMLEAPTHSMTFCSHGRARAAVLSVVLPGACVGGH